MKARFATIPFPVGAPLGAGIVLLWATLWPAGAWAHGEIAGAGQQNFLRLIEAENGKYRVALMHSPAIPTAGELANIELKIVRLLPEPDPLLGSEVPVGLEPEGSLLYADSQETVDSHLPLHSEGEAGIYGVAEYRFPTSGSLLLRFVIPTETGDRLTVEFPVSVSRNMVAFFRFWVNLAMAILILGLTGMQLWKVRLRGGTLPQMMRPLSIGTITLVIVFLLMNFFILDRVLALRAPKVVNGAPEAVTLNEDGTYTIPEAIQKELGIVLVDAKQIPLEASFSAYGMVEADPSRTAEVVAPLWGRIEFADKPLAVGDQVERGQELVRVILELSQLERGPMLVKQKDIQGALQKAKERRDAAQMEYERVQKLYAANPAYEQDLEWAKELLETADAIYQEVRKQDENYVGVIKFRDPRKTPVLAPISGSITSVDFVPGQLNLLDEYRRLFTIADTSQVWVRGQVFLYNAPALRVGQQVLVYAQSDGDRPLKGTLRYIDDAVDPANRTLKVLLDVSNPDRQLLLGAFLRIEFQRSRHTGIVVPEAAVVGEGTNQRVYVALEPERFAPVPVELGLKRDGWQQVLSGVQPGDQVISKGAALLGSLRQEESTLEGANQDAAALIP